MLRTITLAWRYCDTRYIVRRDVRYISIYVGKKTLIKRQKKQELCLYLFNNIYRDVFPSCYPFPLAVIYICTYGTFYRYLFTFVHLTFTLVINLLHGLKKKADQDAFHCVLHLFVLRMWQIRNLESWNCERLRLPSRLFNPRPFLRNPALISVSNITM